MAEISQWRSLIKIDDLSMKAEKGGVSFVMPSYCSAHGTISTMIDTAAPRFSGWAQRLTASNWLELTPPQQRIARGCVLTFATHIRY